MFFIPTAAEIRIFTIPDELFGQILLQTISLEITFKSENFNHSKSNLLEKIIIISKESANLHNAICMNLLISKFRNIVFKKHI